MEKNNVDNTKELSVVSWFTGYSGNELGPSCPARLITEQMNSECVETESFQPQPSLPSEPCTQKFAKNKIEEKLNEK